ncbi:hypothetical protein GCM10009785_15670 [Brooklawnia cerclae]|uniref:Uncharacterized protein n=1 Tax=Brooklawnia cerclae TaxID=349934 RepID=A0ABX0SKK9_9ACTN|nr:hypothetical protein [Brooklawnia cerclae]
MVRIGWRGGRVPPRVGEWLTAELATDGGNGAEVNPVGCAQNPADAVRYRPGPDGEKLCGETVGRRQRHGLALGLWSEVAKENPW